MYSVWEVISYSSVDLIFSNGKDTASIICALTYQSCEGKKLLQSSAQLQHSGDFLKGV